MGLISYLSTLPWWLPISIVFGVNLIFFFATRFAYRHFYPKFVEKGHKLLAAFFKTFYGPLQMIVAVSGLSIMVSLYAEHLFAVSVIAIVKNLIRVGAVTCAAWIAFRFCREVEKIVLEKKNFDKTTIELFSKLSLIVILFLTSLMILPMFGVDVAGIKIFGGVGGVVAGLAAKDALANILGGIVIAIDKPFKIGEWIYSVDEKMEGVVEHIGWRHTKLRQFDKRPLYIPNQTFSSLTFINASRMTNRRIQKYFGIRYCDADKMEAVLEEIREYIKQRPDLDHSLTNYIHVIEFAESSLQLKLRVYTKSVVFKEYMRLTEIILLDVQRIISKHGAEIAFPTTTIDMPNSKEMAKEFSFSLGKALFGKKPLNPGSV